VSADRLADLPHVHGGAMNTREVVITGWGAIGPWGAGVDAVRAALERGAVPRTAVDRAAGLHRRGGARLAGVCRDGDISGLVPPAQARRMSHPSKLAVAALTLALRDSGLEAAHPSFAETGTAIATAFGPSSFTERLLHSIFHVAPDQASPAVFTESVASAAASQVALAARALGPNLTITQRESGGLQAIGDAAAWIRRGRAGQMLAGSVEEMTPMLHAVLDRFGALARGDEIARPFDAARDGMFACEGSFVAVLEDRLRARARGARELAVVTAAIAAFDPSATPIDWGTGGAGLGDELAAGLSRQGIAPASIDLVVSGANGARRGDALEAATLRRAFGGSPPPVVTPKGALGEYGGGHLAGALLALEGGAWPAPWFAAADPALGIAPSERFATPRRLLASALSAGGAATWLVLDRPA
jgi:3-oxoacyl-(acyl-carrier-protein) synthase